MYVDVTTGLRNHTHDALFDSATECTMIYHNMNNIWELADHMETYPHSEIPIRANLLDAMISGGVPCMLEVLHTESTMGKDAETTTGKRKINATNSSNKKFSRTYPDHETIFGRADKITESVARTKTPIVPMVLSMAHGSSAFFTNRKTYQTPCGVYDHTTSHPLVQ
jgi:hypothetical protein